jgi:hypothetical protein
MAGATIDHLVSVLVFIGAILLFISLFNQTIQTAIVYQHHRYIATKCSDLLDNMLLNPGTPLNDTFHWGRSNCTPTSFGLQDPEFTQYRLSPFSLMRLNYSAGDPVYYSKTGQYYSNITMGFGQSLLVPFNEVINYSTAAKLLGVNNTFGFSLTITPIVTVSITETQSNPLTVAVNVMGAGFPLAKADISYCFITVKATGGAGAYPSYTTDYGTNITNDEGIAFLDFPSFDGTQESYVLIAYAHLSGLVGVGYHQHVRYDGSYVVPFISDFDTRKVLIAHSWDVHGGDSPAEISYNATFVLLTEDFTLREMPLENSTGKIGKINYGEGKPYNNITIPTYNPGLLVITYRKSAQESGVVLMPWGISSMAFPISFGSDPREAEWVATDVRQVIVNGIAYQAKLALWSLEGYQVIGQ